MSSLSSICTRHKIDQVKLSALLDDRYQSPVIDCRPTGAFIESHLRGSTSIPASELFERMHELPQRHVSLALYGDEKDLIAAIEFLTGKGYQISKVALWQQAQGINQATDIEQGYQSNQLWAPAKIIRRFIDEYQSKLINEHINTAQLLSSNGTGKLNGLDIACGSGRDMISLAQAGFTMTGVDYHTDSLKRAKRLAQSHQLTINTAKLDLESSENPFSGFKPESFHLVCVLRYLHRPLLHKLDQLLVPGGVILYQTFMQGCEKISSPKNPRFLLTPDELKTVFSSYSIWLNEIELLEDGRPVSAFIAQKAF